MSRPPLYPISEHCDGRRFFNPDHHINRTWWDVLRWRRTSRATPWPKTVPVPAPPHRGLLPAGASGLTWINHATVLLETPQGNLLTDPIFSACAGPFGRLGPHRVHPPGLAIEALPPLVAILLSHDHYDHCDLPSLRRLARLRPQPDVVTPLGNGSLARRAGFAAERIHELDWWDEFEPSPGLHVTATPARHWSNRLSGRRNHRLWSGFFMRAAHQRIYYSGDTGYDEQMFPAIRQRCGEPDLAVLPIGAYEPRWFMAAQHCNPEEAVRIHREVGARASIGIHWGTFQLTDEGREAPVAALAAAREAAGLPAGAFGVLAPGERRVL